MTYEKLRKYIDESYAAGEDVEDFINQFEIIYYGEAIELLSELDPSFTLAAEILSECGTAVKDINSEMMATAVAQNYMTEYAKEKMHIKE